MVLDNKHKLSKKVIPVSLRNLNCGEKRDQMCTGKAKFSGSDMKEDPPDFIKRRHGKGVGL